MRKGMRSCEFDDECVTDDEAPAARESGGGRAGAAIPAITGTDADGLRLCGPQSHPARRSDGKVGP